MRRDEFKGRGVVVLGADVGLGPAIVAAFREAGALLATDGAGPDSVGCIPQSGATPEAIASFLDAATARAGVLHTLVLAARPVEVRRFLDTGADKIRQVIEEELVWYALIMQEAARRMSANKAGRIINLTSMSGKTGVHTGVAPFAAAKGGIIALSRAMAAELGGSGVTVNTVANALMQPQVEHMDAQERAHLARNIPVGRFGQPSEAAHCVMFLASDEAGYITGETLNLSGGRFMD